MLGGHLQSPSGSALRTKTVHQSNTQQQKSQHTANSAPEAEEMLLWVSMAVTQTTQCKSSPTSFLTYASTPQLFRLFVFTKNKINVFCDLEKLKAVPLSGLTPAGVSLLPGASELSSHCACFAGSRLRQNSACLVRMSAAYSSGPSPCFSPAPRPSLALRTHLCFSYIPVVFTSAPCP